MSTDDMTEHDKLQRAIAALKDHQHSFGFDLTQPIAELRRRLAEVASSPRAARAQRPPLGGTAAGAGGIAMGGHVFGDIYHVYQSRQDLWHCRTNTLRGSCRPIARKLDDVKYCRSPLKNIPPCGERAHGK